jgi:sugar lactone lactonase YvrE
MFLGAQRTLPATGLSSPFGAGVDKSGNVYIADSGNNHVVKIAPAGTQTVVSTSPLTLSSPLAVAFDASGNLYVSDNGNNRIVKVPAAGGSATTFANVVTPEGLAVDANGNVFVVDNEDAKIVKITSGGSASDFETGLSNPLDVAVDAAGDVYLADGSLSNIVKYPAVGGAGSNVGCRLDGVSGVAVDRAGNVYVSESGEGAVIVEITPLGTQTTLATSGLAAVNFLAVDSNYDLLIPDQSNNNVVEFSTISVPLGFANLCQDGAPTPCSQTATLQFAVTEDSISNVAVVNIGIPALDFSQSGGSCSGETSPCTVVVTFHPMHPGMRTGAVVITDGDLDMRFSFPVYGIGTGAAAGFNPAATSPPFGSDGFEDPIAVAVAGNGVYRGGPFFVADDEACVIWIAGEGEGEGDFVPYAGTGTCGYSGDGGPATSAELNSPGDVVLDGAGNLYIADSENNLIRKVDVNGVITTVAGNIDLGRGFSGDGGPATSAQMDFPGGIGLDTAGNLYIADSGNNRIRKVDLAGIITTIAGSSAEGGYSGDGGLATVAGLNYPLAVRADTAGNLFIADSSNDVIRKVDLTGKITTVAGDFSLGAGYTGDGGPATSAQLDYPIFVSLDAAGELFISDDDNGVVREVDVNGTITTFPAPTDFPVDLVVDSTGNLAMVDPEDETMTLIARTAPAEIDFGSQNVNTATAAQDVTVTNLGNQALAFSAITAPSGFNLNGADTSCSTESSVSVGLSCILGIEFEPTTATGYETEVALTDNSFDSLASGSQSVPVTGTGVAPQTATTTTLTASPNPAFAGQTVTLTATVAPTTTGGSVSFCLGSLEPTVVTRAQQASVKWRGKWTAGSIVTPEVAACGLGTLLGSGTVGVNGVATLMISNLPVGSDLVTAFYGGSGGFSTSFSSSVTVTINPPTATTTTLTISPSPGAAGQTITLTGTVSPVPTGSPLGSITFCDEGDDDAIVHRAPSRKSAGRMRAAFGVRRQGIPGPCGEDTPLGTVTITAQGTAMLTSTTLTVGDHDIYAVYSGNTGFASSTSDTTDETVNTAYTVTAPQTPFDVAEGGFVQITVTVPPLGGAFNGAVTLVATGLPPRATASFDPPTVTPGTTGAQTVMTIQLVTAPGGNEKSSLPLLVPSSPSGPSWPSLPSSPSLPALPSWPAWIAAAILFLVATEWITAMWRKRQLLRVVAVLLMAGAISAAALGMGGCNGGFAGLSTPKGQYTITITGTNGSLHPSTTVTVVVQ